MVKGTGVGSVTMNREDVLTFVFNESSVYRVGWESIKRGNRNDESWMRFLLLVRASYNSIWKRHDSLFDLPLDQWGTMAVELREEFQRVYNEGKRLEG